MIEYIYCRLYTTPFIEVFLRSHLSFDSLISILLLLGEIPILQEKRCDALGDLLPVKFHQSASVLGRLNFLGAVIFRRMVSPRHT